MMEQNIVRHEEEDEQFFGQVQSDRTMIDLGPTPKSGKPRTRTPKKTPSQFNSKLLGMQTRKSARAKGFQEEAKHEDEDDDNMF